MEPRSCSSLHVCEIMSLPSVPFSPFLAGATTTARRRACFFVLEYMEDARDGDLDVMSSKSYLSPLVAPSARRRLGDDSMSMVRGLTCEPDVDECEFTLN
jgi:hypothetical protein